jgi:hypothetical protein
VTLLVIGYLVWYFRRRRKTQNDRGVPGNVHPEHDMAELEVDDSSRIMIDGIDRHEMRARERPQEAGSAPVYELPHHN